MRFSCWVNGKPSLGIKIMRVFLSWSGERSKAIAEIFHQWLPSVIQAVKPYFSPDDITKGVRWSTEISSVLAQSRVGIICLTHESLNSSWIMFEAGALSKSVESSRVCPLLFDVEPADLVGPLVNFQAAKFSKAEVKRVLKMINAELKEGGLSPEVLDSTLEVWWPILERRVSEVLRREPDAGSVSRRSEREILEEILERTRVADRSERESKGRLLSSLGYVVGEMSSQVDSLDPTDRDRLAEAVELCQQGYNYLKEIGGPAEFMGLNNLVHYSAMLNDVGRREFLLEQARRLRDAGQEHKAVNLVLTGCRTILQFSADPEERRDARERLKLLTKSAVSERDRREAKLYLDSFPEPPGRRPKRQGKNLKGRS
jgi:hypothetical protein